MPRRECMADEVRDLAQDRQQRLDATADRKMVGDLRSSIACLVPSVDSHAGTS
jgi:hypothetical protein